jgi:hypothetical protein
VHRPLSLLVAALVAVLVAPGVAPSAAAAPSAPASSSASSSAASRAGTTARSAPHARAHPPKHRRAHRRAARHRRRSKVIMPLRSARGLAAGTRSAPITWHGGRVITAPSHVYLLWYGDWSATPTVDLVTRLVHELGWSEYATTNGTYDDGHGGHATIDVRYGSSLALGYSRGRTLSDAGVRLLVTGAIRAGRLPLDPDAIYAVLTSADVRESSGFASRYCGWHSRTTLRRTAVHYLFAGDPRVQAPTTCEPRVAGTPHGDTASDALAGTLVHEIDETLTDPDIDAWYDRYGSENADKCAWTFGPTHPAANGAPANVQLGGEDWLIQSNWLAGKHQGCALSA